MLPVKGKAIYNMIILILLPAGILLQLMMSVLAQVSGMAFILVLLLSPLICRG